jgi:hypothetical protein
MRLSSRGEANRCDGNAAPSSSGWRRNVFVGFCRIGTGWPVKGQPSISSQFVGESAVQAVNTNDRKHARPAVDLVRCFPLTNPAKLKCLRQRLVKVRRLRPGTHCFPPVASILAPHHRIVQSQKACLVLEDEGARSIPVMLDSTVLSTNILEFLFTRL